MPLNLKGRPMNSRKLPSSPLAIAWMMSYFVACGPGATRMEESLLEADREFARSSQTYGVDGWVDTFADEGFMVTPGGLIRGQEEIREAMAEFFDNPSLHFVWEPQEAFVDSDGEIGFTIGRYERRLGEGSEALDETGWYMTAWRREGERWVVLADIGSPDERS